jgi:hypothetical protein
MRKETVMRAKISLLPDWPRFALVSLFLLLGALWAGMVRADVEPFVGSYLGSAELIRADGSTQMRDMSVEIALAGKGGFIVKWATITYRSDGTSKEKSYEIEFVASDREDVFAAAMKKNVFGHSVQLDPMKGEPYVWSRIVGDTMTVYSLHVDAEGGYEIQQFDRTLADGGLELEFHSILNGEVQRTISTFLNRQ